MSQLSPSTIWVLVIALLIRLPNPRFFCFVLFSFFCHEVFLFSSIIQIIFYNIPGQTGEIWQSD